jgi:hypothetical protein
MPYPLNLILRSSNHALWLCVSTRTSSSLSSNDFLLILNDRAASAEAGKQRIGDGVAADVVLRADFLALEELEAVEEKYVSKCCEGLGGKRRTSTDPNHSTNLMLRR